MWPNGIAGPAGAAQGDECQRRREYVPARRLESETGYGFGAFGERGLVTPYAGFGLAEAGNRTWRAGRSCRRWR